MTALIGTLAMFFLVLIAGKRKSRPTLSTYIFITTLAALETGIVFYYIYDLGVPAP